MSFSDKMEEARKVLIRKEGLRAAYRAIHRSTPKNAAGSGPEYIYEQKIRGGQIQSDTRQRDVIRSLQALYNEIKNYSPGVGQKYLHTLPPRGVYIYGSVGAGKTMIMDVFYSSIKTKLKRRVHFNDFMADVHSRIHIAKTNRQEVKGTSEKSRPWDPFKPVTKDIMRNCWLLCFDEFQVTDIGDAMILKSLFTELFRNGMVMVSTSNRSPDELYKDGLQRSNFIPFIAVLKNHCRIESLNGPDYRRKASPGIGTRYFITRGGDENANMDRAFNTLCESQRNNPTTKKIKILGRDVTFRKTCGRVLDTTFSELCDRPLGTADYLQIAKSFDTILIRNIPRMNLDNRNQARRFILLIDTLYDRRVRIIVSAATNPQNLFVAASGTGNHSDSDRKLMDDLQIEKGSTNAKSSIFSGSEEVFAFDRTVSRLIEMSSDSYWKRNER